MSKLPRGYRITSVKRRGKTIITCGVKLSKWRYSLEWIKALMKVRIVIN